MRRPLSVALVAIVVLFCASCAPFGGGSGLNPEQKADLARVRSLESIEVFGRDVEPTIIHARNELLTRENYRTSRMNDHISQYDVGDQTLYRMLSRAYDFDEHDPARVRAVFDAALLPLGFDFWQEEREGQGGTTDTTLVWTSERYGVTVHIVVAGAWLTAFYYYTGYLRSDGSSTDPKALADIPGRLPDWFAEVESGTEGS